MLSDLYQFLAVADPPTDDVDREAAILLVRQMISGPGASPARMYPDLLMEGATLPALTFLMISGSVGHVLDGSNDGLFDPRVQIDCWAMSGLDRDALGQAVIAALDGYIGTMVGTEVDVLLFDNQVDTYEPDRKQYRRMLDFRVIHQG